MREPGVVGLGAEAEDDLADLEFGLPEEVAVVGGDESACQVEEVVGGSLQEVLGQLLGLGRLLGGQRGTRHHGLRGEVGFPGNA